MRRGLSGGKFVRLVGGRIKSSVVTEAPGVRIETIYRVADGPWYWHFRQPEACLFWYKSVPERDRRAGGLRHPKSSMKPGDICEVEIEGLGTLSNSVVFES
jgi:hypothetical protein